MIRNYNYYVSEMHCNSCKLLVEETLSDFGFKNLSVDLKSKKITFQTEKSENFFFPKLQSKLAEYNYTLSRNPKKKPKSSLVPPFFLSLIFAVAFLFLESLGLSRFFNPQTITFPAVFIIGIIASLSSCMAVVGSLVLSLSNTKTNLAIFHLSRLISFFLLGTLIGFLGKNLILTPLFQVVFNIIFALALLFLGLSQLEIISPLTLPGTLGKYLFRLNHSSHPLIPVLLGAGTFILPCGFTQSLELYSLTLQNPLSSGLTMFTFALGTFPVLALISLLSRRLKDSSKLHTFQKTTAFLIVFFSLFLLYHFLL